MTTGVPRVAVLLAAYNGMAYIEEQLESILSQVDVAVTVFISVDSSSDGTEVMLDQLALKDVRINILPHGGKFGGAARNFYRLIRDVDVSSFDYVSFADQDDIWLPRKLGSACVALSCSGCDAYSSNITAFWADGREVLIDKAYAQKEWDFIFESAGPGCTYVFTNKLFSKIKERILDSWSLVQDVAMHDWLCYAFARANGYLWIVDRQPSMLYRQHENNQVGANSGLAAIVSRFEQVANGWWLSQARLIAGLVGVGAHPFMKSWGQLSRLQMLKLACHARRCRRRVRDQYLFMVACCVLALIGCKRR